MCQSVLFMDLFCFICKSASTVVLLLLSIPCACALCCSLLIMHSFVFWWTADKEWLLLRVQLLSMVNMIPLLIKLGRQSQMTQAGSMVNGQTFKTKMRWHAFFVATHIREGSKGWSSISQVAMLMPNCVSKRLTTAIRKEMRDYLEQNKRKRPLFQDEGEQAPNVVEVVDVEADTSVIHHPSRVWTTAPTLTQIYCRFNRWVQLLKSLEKPSHWSIAPTFDFKHRRFNRCIELETPWKNQLWTNAPTLNSNTSI